MRSGQQVKVLLAGRHGVDDHLFSALIDEDDGLQQPRVGIEPESQLSVRRAGIVEGFDPQRPLSGLDGVQGRDAMLCAPG